MHFCVHVIPCNPPLPSPNIHREDYQLQNSILTHDLYLFDSWSMMEYLDLESNKGTNDAIDQNWCLHKPILKINSFNL